MGWISLKSLFCNFNYESCESPHQLDDLNKKFEEDYLNSCIDRYRDHCHYPEILDLIKVYSKCLNEFSENNLTPKEAELIKHVLNKGDETYWLNWKFWQPRAKMFAQLGVDKIRKLGFLRQTDLNEASRSFDSFYQENNSHLFFEECSDLYQDDLDSWKKTAFLPIAGEIFRKNGSGNSPKNSVENNRNSKTNSLPLKLSAVIVSITLLTFGVSCFLFRKKNPIAIASVIPFKPLDILSSSSSKTEGILKAAIWLMGGFGSSFILCFERL